MIGSTGVGKTEIARRLARLAESPFLKVEVTKFTEVGYVGRDVESMIRDLTELAINLVKAEEKKKVLGQGRGSGRGTIAGPPAAAQVGGCQGRQWGRSPDQRRAGPG